MTKLILIRHGQTAWNVQRRFRGRADIPLSETGLQQACATSQCIHSTWTPAAIYSSPMTRCIVTAKIIAEPFDVNVQPLDGLNDIDYGQWQGLAEDEVNARWPEEFELWSDAPHLARIPGGETLEKVRARARAALRDILRSHLTDTVIVVSHDSVNRVLLLQALELPLSHYWRLAQDTCGINELNFSNGRFSIRSLNETCHLKTTQTTQTDTPGSAAQ